MKVTNEGGSTAYFPGDDGTVALEPGDTVDVRLGVAEYAVRSVPGVRWASEVEGLVKGVSEASVEAAVVPIAEHVSNDPTDVRYAVVGGVPGSTSVEVVPGSAADHVTPGVSAETPVAAFDVDTADLAELKGYVEANGVALPEAGTGKEGAFVKADYVAAIKATREP